MIRSRQSIFCLATVAAATAVLAVFTACAQSFPQSLSSPSGKMAAISRTPPPPPMASSPVAFFRNLLAMTPGERADFLTNRPLAIRAGILVKVNEYEALDPDERELRLRATELRWYLMPLLQTGPTNRAEQLARVPDDLRDLVKDRLVQWDILPPPLKQE